MPKIIFKHSDGRETTVEAEENLPLMQIAQINNINEIEAFCGGSMACATCQVYIPQDWQERVEAQDNEKTPEEEDILEMAKNLKPTSRLSCQIKITNALDGLTVELPPT